MEKIMETIKYSFVLPAYKARYLKEAIESILNQTYKNFELIIVNDASPENVGPIVSSYDDERIQYYVNHENLGSKDLVAQWNHSISFAKGEYLILASDDDIYMPQYLEKMDILVNKYPNVNVFRPRVKRFLNNGRILEIDGLTQEHISLLEYFYSWTREWVGSGIPFIIFNRKELMKIGGFVNYPLGWFSDDATILKMARNGIVVYGQETLFAFRQSNENISSAKNTKKALSDKLKATKLFYDEHIEFLNNYIPKDEEERHILSAVKKSFKRFIKKNKIRGQYKTSTFWAILSTVKEAMALECVTLPFFLRCCTYPIRYGIKNILVKIRTRKLP